LEPQRLSLDAVELRLYLETKAREYARQVNYEASEAIEAIITELFANA
jgi:hypothetical protein